MTMNTHKQIDPLLTQNYWLHIYIQFLYLYLNIYLSNQKHL